MPGIPTDDSGRVFEEVTLEALLKEETHYGCDVSFVSVAIVTGSPAFLPDLELVLQAPYLGGYCTKV